MGLSEMEKCYEFLFCEETDCIRREIDDRQCWEIENTSCFDHSDIFVKYRALVEGKMDACKKCTYYQIYSDASSEDT